MDWKEAEAFFSELPDAYRAAAVKGLHSAALRGVQDIQGRIIATRSPQPVDRGIYRAGWRAVLEADGAAIENLEPHAAYIEHGVKNIRIGQAMIEALAEWAQRKGMANSTDAVSAAWRIARAMQARGFIFGREGMRILEELVEKYLPKYIEEEVEREIARITK